MRRRSSTLTFAGMAIACLPGMLRHAALALPGACMLLGGTLGAQQPDTTLARCDGRRVTGIVLRATPPPIIGDEAPGWSRPILRALLQHRTSRPSAVRPFVVPDEGEACDSFRLAESERLLRAQPYIADADIRVLPGDRDGVRLEVETVDEIPLVLGVSLRDGDLSKLKYGSSNLLGRGLYAAAEWERGFAYRDAFGARFVHHHVLGRPIRLTMAAERDQLGHGGELAVERPYYTDFQRTAWHAGARESRHYLAFTRPAGPDLSLPYDRTVAEAGGVFRLGRGGVVVFAGPFVSYERGEPVGDAVVAADTGLAADPDPTLDGRYPAFERTSLTGVVGLRFLRYLQVMGFDALLGPQDAGVGTQLAGAIGRSVGTGDGAWVAAADHYAGAGTSRSFVALRTQWEGRREPGGWVNLVGSGRLAWYTKPSPTGTMILGAEYSGASRERHPFQLSLGHDDGGVRGYDDTRVVGAHRAVLRAERRWVIGGVSDWLALGVAGFADAGKMWAGDVPYGRTTGLRTSLGTSLLAAVPRQSRRLVRLDVAVPLSRDADAAGYEVRVAVTKPIATFWREPGDVGRVRAIMPRGGTVAWP